MRQRERDLPCNAGCPRRGGARQAGRPGRAPLACLRRLRARLLLVLGALVHRRATHIVEPQAGGGGRGGRGEASDFQGLPAAHTACTSCTACTACAQRYPYPSLVQVNCVARLVGTSRGLAQHVLKAAVPDHFLSQETLSSEERVACTRRGRVEAEVEQGLTFPSWPCSWRLCRHSRRRPAAAAAAAAASTTERAHPSLWWPRTAPRSLH